MRLLLTIVFGAAVSLAVLCTMWHFFGPFGLVFGMPVLAVFAFPIIDIVTGYPRLVTRIVLRKVEGRYYEFRSRSLDIEIGDDAVCWVSTADVRKLVPSLAAEPVLQRLYADQVRESGDPRQWRITTQALTLLLAKSTDPDVTRFSNWLEKDVARPARNRLERRGAVPR